MSAPLPCPRCEGPARITYQQWGGRDYFGVICDDHSDCGLWLDCRAGSETDAIAAWNRRKAEKRQVIS